jgi:cytochrome P450
MPAPKEEQRVVARASSPADPYFPIGPEFFANPYRFYDRLRGEDPVHWSDLFGGWVLSRYNDVVSITRHPAISARRMDALIELLPEERRPFMRELAEVKSHEMNLLDPPEHARLRGLVSKAFTPGVVEKLKPRIQVLVDEMLDRVQAAREMDIIQDLAYPLPATVIMEMIGVPLEDRDQMKKWSDEQVAYLSVGRPNAETAEAYRRSQFEMMDFYKRLIAKRRSDPQDDLLTGLIAAEEAGDRLSELEMLTTCVFLLVAGHETTTNLIGNGMLALLQNREQFEQLQADPSLIRNAVEEFLRYDTPVHRPGRLAAEDFELHGRTIRKGQLIWQLLGAANRDPDEFPDPNRLDIRRANAAKHVSFNTGAHFCLGAPLARAEAAIAIGTMLRRMPKMRRASDGPPEWNPNMHFRGLRCLPVRFG